MEEAKTRLKLAIREWVHMDNLVESFNHQVNNARSLRSKHEKEAIGLLKELGLSKSTIQVNGASLTLATRSPQEDLTWAYLEREVPEWAAMNGVSPATATSLIKWLQDHRDRQEKESLKKTLGGAPK